MPLNCYKNASVVKNMDNASVEAVRTQLGQDRSPVLERKSKISLVGKKTETGCPDGVKKNAKLVRMVKNIYTPVNCTVRDVSSDGHVRTRNADLEKVFHRNCVLNTCDNVTDISCTRGADDDNKQSNSVVYKPQFGFQPSGTLKQHT